MKNSELCAHKVPNKTVNDVQEDVVACQIVERCSNFTSWFTDVDLIIIVVLLVFVLF